MGVGNSCVSGACDFGFDPFGVERLGELSDSHTSRALNVVTDDTKQSGDDSWKAAYDIKKAPDNITIGGGKSYDDLPENQKYALHITSKTLREGLTLAETSDDSQVKLLNTNGIKAVWYSSVSDKGVWGGVRTGDVARASFRYRTIQFYGDRMVSLLGGYSIIKGSKAWLERRGLGYKVTGVFSRKDAFRYVVGHELGHLTYRNSRINSPTLVEGDADNFYLKLFKGG
ncbi:hypothetical protein KUL10_36660 [Glaciecola sp. KUL10]|nr:hypothetical protein KUL10_36660 [Glaciecola sp. KUL10]